MDLRAKIAEVNLKHEALTKDIREKMAEFKGAETPADKQAEIDAMAEGLDALEAEVKGYADQLESKARLSDRIDAAERWRTESAGRTFAMGGGGSAAERKADAPTTSGVEIRGRHAGVEVKGEFVPICPADEWRANPQLQRLASPEYKAAFDDYIHNGVVSKALSEGTDTAGGFLVPPDFFAGVIQRLPGAAVVEAGARIVTTSRDRILVPRVKAATTDSTMYSSAVAFTMVGETPSATTGDTNPIFEQIEVPVYTAKLRTVLSRNLTSDADFDLSGFLTDEFRLAAALGKDDKYLTGTGAGEPRGIINDSAITVVNSGSASALTGDGVLDLVEDLPAQYAAGAKLYLSKSAKKAIRKLKDGNGNYLWSPGGGSGGLAEPAAPTIAGVPFAVTDFLDSIAADAKPMFYGNLQFFWAILRMQLAVQVLKEKYAEENQDGFVGFLRFGGAVTVPEAFRIQKVAA